MNTNEEQISAAEKFIQSIPDSAVKGNYERWLLEVKSKGRITSEQMDKFIAMSNGLPKELQSYPQEFALSIKNEVALDSTIVSGAAEKKTSKKEAAKVETQQPEKVREGAKLNPDKVEAKTEKPTVVVVNKSNK